MVMSESQGNSLTFHFSGSDSWRILAENLDLAKEITPRVQIQSEAL